MTHDRLQDHPTVAGHDAVAQIEEGLITRFGEGFERFDADDAVDGLLELFPPEQPHLPGAAGVDLIEYLLAESALVLAQRQPDDVDVILFDRALHHR